MNFSFWLAVFKTFVLYICMQHDLPHFIIAYIFEVPFLYIRINIFVLKSWTKLFKSLNNIVENVSVTFCFSYMFLWEKKRREGLLNSSVLSLVWCYLFFLVLVLYYRAVILIFACLIFELWFSLIVIFQAESIRPEIVFWNINKKNNNNWEGYCQDKTFFFF